jgi:small subunit ribosomal protein S13
MARLVGIELPKRKQIKYALPYIYGIGLPAAITILRVTGIDPVTKTDDLTESDINKLKEEIEKNYMVEGDLRRKISMDIKRLQEIGSYRGVRHRRGLPLRGQRTKTNAKTRRGRKAGSVVRRKAS